MADGLSGNFLGSLVELAETGAPVAILTRTEATVRGIVAEVGTDSIVLRTATSANDVLLRTAAIEGLLETGSGHDRHVEAASQGASLVDLLDRYSEPNERIAVTTSSGNIVSGRVLRIGEDQLLVVLDGHGDTMTIPVDAIDQAVMAR